MTAVPSQQADTQLDQLSLFQGDDLGQEGDIRAPESANLLARDHSGPGTRRPGRSAGSIPAFELSSTTPWLANSVPPISDSYRNVRVALIETKPDTEVRELRPKLLPSIRTVGLKQPLVVEWQVSAYQLIAGRARLSVVRARGWAEVPCHVYPPLSQELRALLPLAENVVRQPLTGVDWVVHHQALLNAIGSTERATAAHGVHWTDRRRGRGFLAVSWFAMRISAPGSTELPRRTELRARGVEGLDG